MTFKHFMMFTFKVAIALFVINLLLDLVTAFTGVTFFKRLIMSPLIAASDAGLPVPAAVQAATAV